VTPRKTIAVIAAAALVAGGGVAAVAGTTFTPPANNTFTPVTPVRIVDTRSGVGVPQGALAANSSIAFTPTDVPAGAAAIVANVTVTQPGINGNLALTPDGAPAPVTSNLNFNKGETVPNEVTVAVGQDGQIRVYNYSGAPLQFIVDLEGYYSGAASPAPTSTSASPTPTTPSPTVTTPVPTTTSASPSPTTTTSPDTPTPAGMSGNFTYLGGDEFNGTSLNTNLWTPGWFGTGLTGPVNSGEHQGYDSANVTEPGDGTLHLALTSTKGSLVSSNGKFSFTAPGAYEARVYLPGSSGDLYNWPAAWTDGQNWPADGEIDAMEGLGNPDTPCFHVHTSAGGPGGCPSGDYTGWHTYGFQWSGTTVTFYYDGKNVGSEPYSTGNQPQYLIFDNTSTGSPTPDVMQVDYVRVWSGS